MTLRIPLGARRTPTSIGVFVSMLLTTTAVEAAPPIRTSHDNRVPACVTPDRLMSFVAERNDRLDPRYREIAKWYKHYGEAWDVRWDYAFFQMILETNYLKYRRGDGRRGDVRESQNNFAGIGATGGGVAGERFADIKTGVHAQIQHLVAYSGERVIEPVAKRTRENQDDIIGKSRRLRRAVTFGDLARRWAADRQYARSIDIVASLFKDSYCDGTTVATQMPPRPVPAVRRATLNFPPPSRLGGPKEQEMRLAGPDQLPWAGDATANKPQSQAAPADSETRPKKPKSPVRTIWSREGGADPEPNVERPMSVTAPETPTVAPPALPAEDQASTKPANTMTGDMAAGEEVVSLPRFRIMPSKIEPSKLGGPSEVNIAPPPVAAGKCHVQTASYGGKKTLLLRNTVNGETRYTALTVLDGFEKSMIETFARAHDIRVEVIGEYASKDEALADANANCSGG